MSKPRQAWSHPLQLAQRMLERAFEAGVKASWVAADTVYSSWKVRIFLEKQKQPYALAVPSNFMVCFISEDGVQQPHIATLFKNIGSGPLQDRSGRIGKGPVVGEPVSASNLSGTATSLCSCRRSG